MSYHQAFTCKLISEQPEFENLALLCIETGLGNSLAEARLVTILMNDMRSYLMAASWDKANVDDVLQEALVILLEKLRKAELNDINRVRAFALGIAKNVLIGAARKRAKTMSGLTAFAENLIDDAAGPLGNLIKSEQNDELVRAIGRLGQGRDRDIIFGYYFLGHSANQLCDLHKVLSDHFYRVLYRARKRLAIALENH